MKKILTVILVVLLAGTASAEFSKVGSAGAQFLKIGVGSRYLGMGEASVATANDVYAMYWNPAGLVEIEDQAISFTNVNWVLDINLNYVGYAHYFEDVGVFGVSASVLSMDDQEITTVDEQEGTGEFYSAYSYSIGLSFARQLTNRFAFGLTAKHVGEKIGNVGSGGVAFDFGTLLYTGFRTLRMGMSITNMGPELKFTGSGLNIPWDQRQGDGQNPAIGAQVKTTPYDLPMTFRFGLAYDVELSPKSSVTFSSELKHPNDNLQQGALGAEWNWDRKFFLRSGYKLNYDEEGLAFGAGLNTSLSHSTSLVIDYAWLEMGRLQESQRFTVGFVF
jgi:long-subunit fatty acid transport protein